MDDVASPCIKVCTIDPTGQWCLGCGRTLDEISGWLCADRAQRLEILVELPDRLIRLNQKLAD
ncbi:MAG TPA: DUF1289 domain-containing protein [Sphingorhabdus sp.]|uniref:DUF1289 domain-containing protein n=1 Tax=Sphingorhabdus sp. TaxID=1902408 RepID=UPI002C431975|nr:DUF1289 domain-containing protein [Sphingorhabdus sp.]HMT40630.1 DUF1289 domain-containing protein [Sphingorhabdus sp.]HMU21444.1 DUF1289 domain-containing protein [Sphingorhabdus sp.]